MLNKPEVQPIRWAMVHPANPAIEIRQIIVVENRQF
jgi:hypothetical protein